MFLLRRSRSAIVLATGLIAMVPSAVAQRGVTTLGLQVKPVIALDYFDRNTAEEIDHVRYTMNLQGGIAFGMNVRVGVTNMISFETGIGQIQRRYSFRIVNDTSGFDATGTMKYVGYEMPIMGLVFIRLGERAWMNTALGASMDFYPSDAEGFMADAAGRARIFRKNWAQGGVIGNIGVEYRTYKSGTFYLGATYHRPFNDMAVADMTWTYRGPPAISTHTVRTTLNGSYLTVDLRYYFHEDPARRKAPRTK
ncbi:MAG: hypothetical protein IPP83_00780 [Flavobacteriales bacterium]|nr:hypothetical protein [Flavobacteriales bacterium]